ncbi:Thermolysin metallopeptidase, catalytic domain [Pedococcus cremeus]|uniref:Neutral metalloproteinase n=1 Tax=Pedococcus cremeus TaxID=587636 RepID=A0A1H9W5Z5_9MICO|nr:protealysin inhibitor emfourin [Pedococcus cremeus]SES29204.1 Thermolysin metallopeptidase, catalytic domain [Pedococcus cremeus]
MLQAIAESSDPVAADRAVRALERDASLRERRRGRSEAAPAPTLPPASRPAPGTPDSPQRVVSDAGKAEKLPGRVVRREGEPATGDAAADEAYDGLGATWELYATAYGRNSLDGRGLPLLASVHYGTDYDNAFWDGTQMVFGDGDGRYFQRFTASLDVIGHELTHGVTELTAGLTYRGQPGALNESISDVFGSLVRQRLLGQRADQADWLIGADLLTDAVHGVALRSLAAPGTAYDDPVLGKDPQPAHMDAFVQTADDNGGVHINSGIPNHAFYLAATAVGGYAWERVGRTWYAVLTGPGISADCDFATFARLTVDAARAQEGESSSLAEAVQSAWEQVGVLQAGSSAAPAPIAPSGQEPTGGEGSPGGEGAPGRGTEVLVRRTGGFAGLTRERSVRLEELPGDDADQWTHLLATRRLSAFSNGPIHPDAYCYEVRCDAPPTRVSMPEPRLPEEVRGLLERTLASGD